MTFDQLSWPIPEELLAAGLNRDGSLVESNSASMKNDNKSDKSDGQDMNALIDEYEYHSRMAAQLARKISDRFGIKTSPVEGDSEPVHTANVAPRVVLKKAKVAAALSALEFKHVDTVERAFARKPRSIQFLPSGDFVASAMDGSLMVWNGRKKLREVNVGGQPECMVLLDERILLAVKQTDQQSSKLLFYDNDLKLQRTLVPSHSKPTSAVEWISDSLFCSASEDHSIVIQKTSTGNYEAKLTDCHTSAVYCLKYLSASGKLLSGGADGRLSVIDPHTGVKILSHRVTSNRITQLLISEQEHQDPNTIIIQRSSSNDQFAMVDLRAPEKLRHSLGWPEQGNMSRFLRGDWRGNAIICGTQAPADKQSRLMLFDLRRSGNPAGPVATYHCPAPDRRWLECQFSVKIPSMVLATATDGSLSFVNIKHESSSF